MDPRDVVRNEQKMLEDTNTGLAYGSKQVEYNLYCDHMEPLRNDDKYIITPSNFYNFLYYTSRRSKYSSNKKGKAFNVDECVKIRQDPTWISDNPVGWQTLNQYKCGIQEVWEEQLDAGKLSYTKDLLITKSVKDLLKIVKTRKVRISKINFKEKVTAQMAPYSAAEELPRLEFFLYRKKKNSKVYCVASLRDRFCLLQTSYGILRGESLILSELSDLIDIVFKITGIKMHIGVMQIFQGKTNKSRTIYGRVMRHKDVTQCAMGAMAFYLLMRFAHTNECDEFDFSQNGNWFNIKLLTDVRNPDNTIPITDHSYAKSIRAACDELSIVTKHYAHFGRGVGAAIGNDHFFAMPFSFCIGKTIFGFTTFGFI